MATGSGSNTKERETKPVMVAKTAVELQRMKLEKLMENPDKPVILPDPPKEKILAPPPEFNRNVMGSSAGAGSGEFHVYRHIRRREYARQKYIGEKAEKESKNIDFHQKLEDNRKLAEEKTSKKRAKRMRKKMNAKLKKLDAMKATKVEENQESENSSEEQSDNGSTN